MEARRSYDVVVIGSGASGGTLAYGLARKGADVLLVEHGDFVKPPAVHDSLDRRIGFAQSEYGPSRSLPCVGGPTKFYGSALYRLRTLDFRQTRLEAGESAGWPITYEELEPYYAEAERVYAVHGSSEGDPTEPPRSSPYPYPPIAHQGFMKDLAERLHRRGASVGHIPRGLDYREGGKCVLCATCDGYYCRLDAKMDAEIACVRPAIATGHVTLMTHTECRRVLLSPDGKRATGVRLRRGATEFTVSAASVAVSAGVLETPVILRRSRTSAHPAGIGNDTGCLGRYICGHTVVTLVLVMSPTPLPPTHTKTLAINSFYGPSDDWPYPQGVIQIAGQLPTYDQSAFVQALLARSLVCFCMTEEPSSADRGLTFSESDDEPPQLTRAPICSKTSDRLARRAARLFRDAGCGLVLRAPGRNVGWHGVGGARMGNDPRTSVTDAQGRVHGLDNLYVVDSSALPSPGAVNTGLTLMAMALRAAETISGHKAARAPSSTRAALTAPADGAIVQTPLGPVAIRGAIHAKWKALREELTPDGDDAQTHLGHPLDEATPIAADAGGGVFQLFHRGIIVERSDGRTFVVYGAICDAYLSAGGVTSPMGQPTSDEEDAGHGGRVSHFQYGDIYWRADTGPRVLDSRGKADRPARTNPFARSWRDRGRALLRRIRR
jgi:choline dehydrogenase-like flavoprotein